ncbi:hypothetical protein AMTR_s00005p00061720 [Amborella trichopoda]|uniref:Uncharacterized protein n=1 Tax=Amborella trichopoda TaxID=13333 RepID=W1PGC0_AMBTC|nr:hypothetical protein AMTR_s00005p00061720 [Amborella trichopoda]
MQSSALKKQSASRKMQGSALSKQSAEHKMKSNALRLTERRQQNTRQSPEQQKTGQRLKPKNAGMEGGGGENNVQRGCTKQQQCD